MGLENVGELAHNDISNDVGKPFDPTKRMERPSEMNNQVNKSFDPTKRMERPSGLDNQINKPFDPTKRMDKPVELDELETQKLDQLKRTDSLAGKEIKYPERMESQIVIKFKCPDSMSKNEYSKQLANQEKGLNNQSIKENMTNREKYELNGRDSESSNAQTYARQKAFAERVEKNQEKGMSYSEAKKEATEWIGTQAALHDPDQVAGGDPKKVNHMGDARVNSSIGSQWRSRVGQLADALNKYAEGKSDDELSKTKLNVKLTIEE